MKVKELIAELQKCDPEHRVVVDGYEGGMADIGKPITIKIVLNINEEWYYGSHEHVDSYKAKDVKKRPVHAVYFSR